MTSCESLRNSTVPSSRNSACARWASQKSLCEGVITTKMDPVSIMGSQAKKVRGALRTSGCISKCKVVDNTRKRRRKQVSQRCDRCVLPTGRSNPKERHRSKAPAEVARGVESETIRGESPDDDGVRESDGVWRQVRWAQEVGRVECCEDNNADEDTLPS